MKLTVIILFILISFSAISQITKGSFLLGGTFSISNKESSSGEKTSRTTTLNGEEDELLFKVHPYWGGFVADNFAMGLALGYDYTSRTEYGALKTSQDEFDNKIKQKIFSISPFVRYYKQISDKAYLFTNVVLYYGTGTYKQLKINNTGTGTENDIPYDVKLFTPQLVLGFNYFISKNVAIEINWTSFYFSKLKISQENPTTSSEKIYEEINYGLGLSFDDVYFGLIYFY